MATTRPPARPAGTRTPAQTFALAFGAVYVLIGVLGFVFSGFENFATWSDKELIIFSINPLHNLVHLGIGALWIGASRNHATAKTVNLVIGVVYLLVALLGFLEVEFVSELLNINDGRGVPDDPSATNPDNFLHLISGAAAVYFGSAGAEGTAGRTTA